jgi:hypothetical protein
MTSSTHQGMQGDSVTSAIKCQSTSKLGLPDAVLLTLCILQRWTCTNVEEEYIHRTNCKDKCRGPRLRTLTSNRKRRKAITPPETICKSDEMAERVKFAQKPHFCPRQGNYRTDRNHLAKFSV